MDISEKMLNVKVGIILKSQLIIVYNEIERYIEPHIVGYNKDKILLRAFEVKKDGVPTDELKLYFLSNITSIKLTRIKFNRTILKSTDEAIPEIIMTTYNGKKKKENS